MKLPRIESSYNPRASGSNVIGDTAAGSIATGLKQFGGVVDALYESRMKDIEEQIKADQVVYTSNIQNQLFAEKAKLMDEVETAGDYSTFRDKWQKNSEKIISGIEKSQGVDEVWKQSLVADLRRDQISTDFQIADVIKQRRKKDVAIATNNSIDTAKQEFLFGRIDDVEYAKRIGASLGNAASANAIDTNEINSKARTALSEGIALKTELLLQEQDFTGARKLIDTNKEIVTPETFVKLNSAVTKIEYEQDSVARVQDYVVSGGTIEKPDKKQFDIAYTKLIQQSDPQNFAADTVSFIESTGHVPSPFKQQVATSVGNMREDATEKDIATAVFNAQVLSELPDGSLGRGYSKAEANASLLVQRMQAGMSQTEAYRSVAKQANDPNFDKLYKSARTSISTNVLNGKVDIAVKSPSAQSEFIELYALNRAIGATDEEAVEIANKKISKNYGEFNGEFVKMPPTKATRFNNEKDWIEATKPLLTQTGFNVPDGAQIVIAGDSETQSQKLQGASDLELTFPVMIKTDFGTIPLIYNKGENMGKRVRVKANANFGTKDKNNKNISLDRFIGGQLYD